MEIDKTTIGLSLILAVVVAMLVFSASLPATAEDATQNATSTVNTSAVKIVAQDGNASKTVTYWNFTGMSGTINATPTNNQGDVQDPGTNQKGICTLNNTNSQPMSAVYITNSSWSDNSVIKDYKYYNHTSGTAPGTAADIITAMDGSDEDVGAISADGNTSIWLKVQLKGKGSATSTFTVTSEV
jgi:hypothetical protein